MLVLLAIVVVLGLVNAVLVALLLSRSRGTTDASALVQDQLRAGREESATAAQQARAELAAAVKSGNEALVTTLTTMSDSQRGQLDTLTKQLQDLTESNQASLDKIRTTVDARVKELQEGNEKKLEEMRKTVDEKLQSTLETRLTESFKQVGDHLEAVQRGLGEMQSLATGVGDLKRVLTNVKARGTWAEVQLAALLEQVLAPSQYDKNVHEGGLAGSRRVRHPASRSAGAAERVRVAADRLEVPAGGLPAHTGGG